jgi:phospholipid/cholesterol/gamma-HCH transport system substrate-binding protein
MISRLAALGALILAAVLVVVLLLGGDQDGHSYTLEFENASQLVEGNEVRMGGHTIGSVDEVDLADDFQAEVTISVDEALHQGTTATVRSTSLSGIANRYVSITDGPEDEDELEDGAILSGRSTSAAVELDQLFDTFTPRTRQALRDFIQGFATVYAGRGEEANETYKYLAPGLQSTERLLAELNRDSDALTGFLVESSRTVTAIAERRNDLSSLVSNANQMLGAIARENEALDRSLELLPDFLRRANTTFVNLRGALDDLDPLVATAKPATEDLAPFLADLRPVAEQAVPVFRDLRLTLRRPGDRNDLLESLRLLPGVERSARRATPNTLEALDDAQPVIEFARPYTPDLLGWFTKFGQVTAFYDAAGHYARVSSANLDLFEVDTLEGELEPIPPEEQFDDLQFEQFTRCPGGAVQPIPGSNPFTDNGRLLSGGEPPNPKCDPSDVLPGP